MGYKERSLSFYPAGTLLSTGSEDGTVRVWSVASGECKGELEQSRSTSGVHSVTFSAGPVYGAVPTKQKAVDRAGSVRGSMAARQTVRRSLGLFLWPCRR